MDLVMDVLAVAWEAAKTGKGRRWRRSVPFISYLYMTMRGVASDARRSELRRNIRTRGDAFGYGDPLGCSPSVEEEVLEKEEAERREELYTDYLEKALVYFTEKGDKEVLQMIEGFREGLTAHEIREMSSMTQLEYEAAHRRWRRGLDHLFPDRRGRT